MAMKDFVFALDRLNEYSPSCDWRTPIWTMMATRELESSYHNKEIDERKYLENRGYLSAFVDDFKSCQCIKKKK